jgi:hypothetical protein
LSRDRRRSREVRFYSFSPSRKKELQEAARSFTTIKRKKCSTHHF